MPIRGIPIKIITDDGTATGKPLTIYSGYGNEIGSSSGSIIYEDDPNYEPDPENPDEQIPQIGHLYNGGGGSQEHGEQDLNDNSIDASNYQTRRLTLSTSPETVFNNCTCDFINNVWHAFLTDEKFSNVFNGFSKPNALTTVKYEIGLDILNKSTQTFTYKGLKKITMIKQQDLGVDIFLTGTNIQETVETFYDPSLLFSDEEP